MFEQLLFLTSWSTCNHNINLIFEITPCVLIGIDTSEEKMKRKS